MAVRNIIFILIIIAFLSPSLAQDSTGVTEVLLEAYSSGFYRPALSLTFAGSDSLDSDMLVDAASRFSKRLEFALIWTGYVDLVEKAVIDSAVTDTPFVSNFSGPPPTELLVSFTMKDGALHATSALSEADEAPHYQGGVDFDRVSAENAAEASAEEILRRMTGMTPPFRSYLACVEPLGNNVKELVILAFDGGNRWQLTYDQSIALSPSWAPDGRRIVFSSFRGGGDSDLYIIDLDAKKVKPLLQRNGTDAAPRWSPDGAMIVFAGSNGMSTDLYFVRPDGTHLRNLTQSRAIDTSPDWSPTGRDVIFVSDRSGTPQIYKIDRDGTNLLRLTYEGRYNSDPSFSPAGDRIVYTRREDKGFQIHLIDPNGDVDIPLTNEYGDHTEPSWSPDGMKITYAWRGKLWVMSADGSDKRELLGKGLMASWSPIPE